MVVGASVQLFHHFGFVQKFGYTNQFKRSEWKNRPRPSNHLSSRILRQDAWSREFSTKIHMPLYIPYRQKIFRCRSSALPNAGQGVSLLRNATLILTRSCNTLLGSDFIVQLVPALGVISFGIWGLVPLMRYLRILVHNDSNWKKSKTYYISTSYLQPLLLWIGATLICRVLDPINLPLEVNQAVKQRVLTFVRSLSAVLAFAFCLSNLIQQTQKFFVEANAADDTRKMGFQFAGKAIYTAVWVAAVSLFMELLGFSTQKWLTAGGLGTVLLTLAGREIFTNFLSSVMIHATRPFILNEWIQTKIEGYEVSGTVEHVGWWSPTIIRGDDREAVHIPNHKFTVTVVRNLSQRTHWRIKTHLAISHLDANKISNIVADMRKVLAKNPQIEQQRLHRRVFLDNVDRENQALMIMVSCFVKTTHFEEYLCVKEAILLDLLRVISHHRARLATPIRTVQKEYGDPEIINIPFAENIYSHPGPSVSRPFLLIEPPTKINSDDKAKSRSSPRSNEDQIAKTSAATEVPSSESTILNNPDKQQEKNVSSSDVHPKSSRYDATPFPTSPSASGLEHLETLDTSSKISSQKPPVPETATESNDAISPSTNAKSEAERAPTVAASAARPAFEDNIVLGLALEGSKRTLPIEEGMGPSSTQLEANELAAGRAGSMSSTSAKEKKGPIDQRDQER